MDLAKEPVVLGPSLAVDTRAERFVGDWSEMADLLIKRDYREPFVVIEKV